MKKTEIENPVGLLFLVHFVLLVLVSIIMVAQHQETGYIGLVICLFSGLLSVILYYWYHIKYGNDLKGAAYYARLNRILYELIHTSSQFKTREALYQEILEKTVQAITNASKGCILLLEEGNILRYQAVYGYDESLLKNTYLLLEQSFLYLESKGHIDHTVIVHDPFEYDKKKVHTDNMKEILKASPCEIQTTLSTPIIIDHKLHGMINVDSEIKNAFNREDIKAIEFFAFEVVNVIKLFDSLEHNQYLLNRDVLTGIYNRRFFNTTYNKWVHDQIEDACFSLISFDLNNLKRANDHFGHEWGDKLLIGFAEGVKQFINEQDLFARYGGDEFLLLLSKRNMEQSEQFIQVLKEYFDTHWILLQDTPQSISFSYGISCFPEDGDALELLIKNADCEMYKNKREYHLSLMD